VPGAVRVGHHNRQVGLVEGEVVVAAVPQDDIHFLFGLAQDGFVIHAGIDDNAVIEVRFVFLALFNGAFVLIQVGVIGEALHLLLDQVAVGHGVADGRHAVAHSRRISDTRRVVWLLPEPVRTAHTETTGLVDLIWVVPMPIRRKSAPAASTAEAGASHIRAAHRCTQRHLVDACAL
jgi:hypothetical protein